MPISTIQLFGWNQCLAAMCLKCRMLKDSSHQLVMITGDAPLTACHTASKVHIVTRDCLILSPTAPERQDESSEGMSGLGAVDRNFEWVSPDEAAVIPFSASRSSLLEIAANWDLCITGDSLSYLLKRNVASFVIPMVQVWLNCLTEKVILLSRF